MFLEIGEKDISPSKCPIHVSCSRGGTQHQASQTFHSHEKGI
jgi:hypothetical protein